MKFELLLVKRSADEQHRTGESNLISKLVYKQNSSGRKKIRKKSTMSHNISKSRRWFCSFIISSKINIVVVVLFISLSIILGVLTVILASHKQSKICQLNFKRTMKSSLISSSQPRSVAVGDLNNDHQIDIVVANSGTNTIGIFLSKDDETFTDQQTYSTGSESRPYAIVVNDFNNDNYLDIAVANYGTNNIGIFLGNGNGTFNDQKVLSLGDSRPLFITVGDFNNDNRIDIAVVNYGTNSVGILLGYGNGSFQNQATYSTGYDSIPYSLAIGNFNNDDQLDIAVANYGTDNVGILLGNGNGTFANQQTYTTLPKSNPSSTALGDFNNDNQLDVVVANHGTGNVGLFLGHGNGTFLAQIIYLIGFNSYPQFITIGDLNKDNQLDIVIVDSTNDQVHILPGYGNGSFATITTYDAISESSPFWVAVADFNNNDESDIVVANYGTNCVLLLIDYSIQPSVRQTNYHIGRSRTTAVVAFSDFNNDHIPDIVFGAPNRIYIRTGLGNGTFGRDIIYSTGNGSAPQYICVGDLNNDNKMDIVIADRPLGRIDVFLGYGDGTFTTMTTYSTGDGSSPFWVALGDFDHDNRLDIVSANQGTNTVGILLGNGDGTFVIMVPYSTVVGIGPYAVAVGDMNNDTHLDFVVADWACVVIIFLGYGNGRFIIWSAYSTGSGSYPFSIALADFNNDNRLDIAVANIYTNNIGVFLGYGNGTCAEQTTYLTGSGGSHPFYVIVADFNNDHIHDIIGTNFGTDEVFIFYGYGNGSFEFARNYPTGFGSKPYGITIADFDNNKQLEIVVALFGTGNIAVLTEYNAAEFVKKIKYSTGSAPQPVSVAIGDFNNDNRSDIVVANSGTDNLGILLGMGNGTFGMEMMYPIGPDSDPQYVITCDINKDNQLDIVSVNSKMNSISVIMGYGNGTFAEQMIYPTGYGSYPYAVASGDFNNDTHLDLVIANEGTDSIGILYGFNYTSFQSPETYSSIDSLGPLGIVVSDLNNDKFQDIAAVFAGGDSLGILLGYGNGSFTIMMIYSTGNGSEPHGIAVGDLNNDGQLDIVVANVRTNNIGVLLGYGNGTFANIMTYSTGDYSFPYSVAVGDLNNDDRLDIIVANNGDNSVGVLLGYGNGNFSIVNIYSTGRGSSPFSVAVGDFNNDDRMDIVVSNRGSNVGVLFGYGNGTFGDQVTLSKDYSYGPVWVTVGDFNSDNRLDIASANSIDNSVSIFLGHGNGTFADFMTYSTGTAPNPLCVNVGDFNNDNHLDIAVANYGTNDIVVLFGVGDGSFLLGKAYSTGKGSKPYALAVGDFNNDTRLDIATANSATSNIKVFLGYENEPFAAITKYTTGDGSQPHSVAIGDFNNDSRVDIAVANYGTNNVAILLGHSNRVFDPIMTYLTGNGSAPYSVAIGDFNNDHYLDIVVTNSGTNSITILLGYGNGTFFIGATYSTETRSQPYTVTTGDFNNDNISDIAIANSGTNNIFLFYGYGNGTFGNKISYTLDYRYHPYSIAVTDLDEDGWMDIVIACYDTDHIETLIKMC